MDFRIEASKDDEVERVVLQNSNENIQKQNRNVSQCLIDAYNLTEDISIVKYIAERKDIKQTRSREYFNRTCMLTYHFEVASENSVGLSEDEKNQLRRKDLTDILFRIYEITKATAIEVIVAERKDVIQTRTHEYKNGTCVSTYSYNKILHT